MKTNKFLISLRALPLENIEVKHNPMTERYRLRAITGISYILRTGECIGWRNLSNPILDEMIEIVVWSDPLFEGGCGFYVCLRLHYLKRKIERAVMFCFYDGTDKSPCISNKEEAVRIMNKWAESNNAKYEEA